MQGFGLFLLTQFGDPEPWSPQEVQKLTSDIVRELENPRNHVYSNYKRVWAQKPLEEKTA